MKNLFVYYCCAVESVGNTKRFPNVGVKLKTFPHHGTFHSLKCKHLAKTLHTCQLVYVLTVHIRTKKLSPYPETAYSFDIKTEITGPLRLP